MAYSPAAIESIYDRLGPHLSSLRRGGIYANKSGYHNSRNANRSRWPGDYSIIAPADKRGDGDAAAAIDISLGPAEMKLVTKRLMDACEKKDPRIECVREALGTLNGRTVTGWNRYATGSGSRSWVGKVTADSTHLWHVHISFFRAYATDRAKMQAVADVILGIPLKATPAPTPAPAPAPEPKEWSDMATEKEIKSAVRGVVRDELGELFKGSVKVAHHYPYEISNDDGTPKEKVWMSTAIAREWEILEVILPVIRESRARLGALESVMAEMAKNTGVTPAQLEAAAKKGAQAALDETIDAAEVTLAIGTEQS
jgi:hypothetical protein